MAQPQLAQIKLSRFDAQPWGFRLQGGVDFATPLLVQKVNAGSLSEKAGLLPGDAVIKINDVDVFNMRHKDAQDIVVRSGNNFVITVQRGGSTWRPHVTPTGAVPQPNQPNSPYLQTVTKTSLAHKQPQDSQHIGCGYNNAARPFANGSGEGNMKNIVNKQYNTPVGIYSDESIAETLSAQAEVLAGGVLGVNFKKNEKEYQAEKSEVLKFLREEETGHSTPAFGHSQHYQDPSQASTPQHQHHHDHHQQQQQQQHHHQQQQHQYSQQQQQQHYNQQHQHVPQQQQQQQYHHPVQVQAQSTTRHVSAPVNTPKPPSTGGLPTGQNICSDCERLITGVFVRIKDKNLHIECFKCATCGTSLKNQGYYNFNNKLYCDIHAKLAAQQHPPPGTEAMFPYPLNRNNTKLSASTISSALSSHGYNGVSNGNSAPAAATAPLNNAGADLPLPPPPSPTQLMQLETGNHHLFDENDSNNNNHDNGSTLNCRTYSIDSLSSSLSNSLSPKSNNALSPSATSTSVNGVIDIALAYNNNNNSNNINNYKNNHNNYNNGNNINSSGSTSTSSTLSLDGLLQHQNQNQQQHSSLSPMHSRQTSSSSSSQCGYEGSNSNSNIMNCYAMKTSPLPTTTTTTIIPTPPPPPPPSSKSLSPLNLQKHQQQYNNNNKENNKNILQTQNHINSKAQPLVKNAYNQLLKEFSNKIQQPHIHNTNNNNNNNNNNTKHEIYTNNEFQNKLKSFNQTISQQKQPTLGHNNSVVGANQLKFNSSQVKTPPSSSTELSIVNTLSGATLLDNNNCQNLNTNNQQTELLAKSASVSSNMSINYEDELALYGTINTNNNKNYNNNNNIINNNQENNVSSNGDRDQPFEYVTLTGNVIRSVVPPGKGMNINYRVNQGYARPFGAPQAAAKSPVSFPPQQQQQQWGAPQQQQQQVAPKPAANPYATLPRSNMGGQPQGRGVQRYSSFQGNTNYNNNNKTNYNNYNNNNKNNNMNSYNNKRYSQPAIGLNRYSLPPNDIISTSTSSYNKNYYNQEVEGNYLQPLYAEECFDQVPAGSVYFESDSEVEATNRRGASNFRWPPPMDEVHDIPTAAPLYIPPPETQHVITKPPIHREQVQPTQIQNQSQSQTQSQTQWQSRSAPTLSAGVQQVEVESGSDSFTSSSTTTTHTSDDYQRMYAAQAKSYQMQQTYDQSESDFDCNTDTEVSAMRVNEPTLDANSGRRSVQECADSLSATLNMYIDMEREATPSSIPPHSQGSRRVAFSDEPQIQEAPTSNYSREEAESNSAEDNKTDVRQLIEQFNGMEETDEQDDELVIERRGQILESQRLFQPTPEIIFEIPPVRHIPPTKIPNPTPKEWINPMVRALTTAPEVPFHMPECLCPKPCDDDFMSQETCHRQSVQDERKASINSVGSERRQSLPEQRKASIKSVEERKPPEEPPQFLRESPPKGSKLTKAMATASEFTVRFAPAPSEVIPLPEEQKAYMPPPMDLKPYMREDFRPKSPFLSALTTAPEKPFESQFDRDVPIHEIDLPTPKEHLTMSSALCIASDREYTPLNPENATHRIEEEQKRKQQKKHEFQVLDHEEELGLEITPAEYYVTEKPSSKHRKSSAFAAMQAFQPSREPLENNTPRNSVISMSKDETDLEYNKYCKAVERNQKRLSYFQKKEEELKSAQDTQPCPQTNTNINNPPSLTNHRSSISSSSTTHKNNVDSSASYNSSSTVQENNNNNNNNNNNYTIQTPRSSFSATTTACHQKTDVNDFSEIIEETVRELNHSPIIFPPPSPLSHLKAKTKASGLHRPESIPKYQRNWTVLPTQSPSRTPEPQELRDNVPLAFVDAHKTTTAVTSDNHVHRPVAIQSVAGGASHCSSTPTTTVSKAQHRGSSELKLQLPVINVVPTATTSAPIILNKDHSGPVNMAFQSLDEYVSADESQAPSRPYTPCSMSNKPVPIIPYYQTPEKLCFDECEASHERPYNTASPFPDRAHSPAPGPPPNPLAAIRAPRVKGNELTVQSARNLQAGSISTGQSYLGARQQRQQQRQQQYLENAQGQVLSHFETTSQAQAQSLTSIPETIESRKVGNMTVEERRRESHMQEQKQSQTQSQTKTQVGNTQIERRRKVTEEFEHSQTAKTIEIRTGSQSSSTARRESYGKTGYVANQARRLSSLEQEISDLTSQSQAISARAAEMMEEFPQLKSPEPTSKFPTKPLFPPHDEPKAQTYMLYSGGSNMLVAPPPGFKQAAQQQAQQRTKLCHNQTKTATLPANNVNVSTNNYQSTDLQGDDATAMLTDSLSSMKMGDKMKDFMAESGKIIANMLEARIANQNRSQQAPQQYSPSQSASSLSLRNNNTNNNNNNNNSIHNNLPRSPALKHRRFILDDFSKIDPTEPAALKPVIVTSAAPMSAYEKNIIMPIDSIQSSAHAQAQAQAQVQSQHPMGKVLDICDSNNKVATTLPTKSSVKDSSNSSAPVMPLPPSETVIYRNNAAQQQNRDRRSTHARDRRSYIETNNGKEDGNNTTAFSISVKALGKRNGAGASEKDENHENTPMSPENEEVVSQLIKDGKQPICCQCNNVIEKGPFITALGRIWCPEHFICVNANCRRPLQDIGFVEEKGDLYCEYCFEKYLAPTCSKCNGKIKGDCLNAIGRHFHPECFNCSHCGKIFGNTPFFLEDGSPYCEADWNELFTTKCFACGFPVEAGDRWVEALNHNYHSQCFNCTYCKQNLEGQSFYNKGGRPFCKNHAR